MSAGRRTYNRFGLNARQERFCQEYVTSLNGAQSAIKAGYSPKAASSESCQQLSKVKIQNRIAILQGKASERLSLTADRVLEELMRLAFVDLRLLYNEDGALKPMSEWPEDAARAVSAIDHESRKEGRGDDAETVSVVKIRTSDKTKALHILGNHLKLFIERHELTGKDGGPIENETRVIRKQLTKEELKSELEARGLPTSILEHQ